MSKLLITATALTAVAALAVPAVAGPTVNQELAQARAATAQFHRVSVAEDAGYGLDPAGPLHECITALDGHGAMGMHWANGSLIDTTLDPAAPEVLVYEPTKNGHLRLVALEYVVFADAWEAAHPGTTPQMFDRDMTLVAAPNRYELPSFWQRHVWLWKNNPHGMFMDHNPTVTCEHAP